MAPGHRRDACARRDAAGAAGDRGLASLSIRRLRGDAYRLGPRRASHARGHRSDRLSGERRPWPCRSAEPPVLDLRRSGHRRSRDALLRRLAVARLLPQHRGTQHDRGRRRESGGTGRIVRLAAAAAGAPASSGIRPRTSTFSTPSTMATRSLPQPVIHRRRVIFIKPFDGAQGTPAYWILVDDLSGSGRHDVDLTFQFAGGNVALGPHPWARAGRGSRTCLWISPFPSAPAQPALKCGEPSPICGWIAPEFTRLSPAPMLIYSFAVALPWRIVTLLLPDRQGLVCATGSPAHLRRGRPAAWICVRPAAPTRALRRSRGAGRTRLNTGAGSCRECDANSLGEDGRPVAVDDRRAGPQPAHDLPSCHAVIR